MKKRADGALFLILDAYNMKPPTFGSRGISFTNMI